MSISRGDLGVVVYFFVLNAAVIYVAATRWFELRKIPVPSRRGDTTFAICTYVAIAVYVAMSLFFVIGVDNSAGDKSGDLSSWSEHVRFWMRLYATIGLLPLTFIKIAGELLLIGALARRQPLNQPIKKGNAYMWAVNILIWVVIILPSVLSFTVCRSGNEHASCPVWWAPKATPAVAFMHVLLTGVLLFAHWQASRWDDGRPSTPNVTVAFGMGWVAALVEFAWALTITIMLVQGKREYQNFVVVFCLLHVVLFLGLQGVLRGDLEARKARAMEVPGLLGQQDLRAGTGFTFVSMNNRA